MFVSFLFVCSSLNYSTTQTYIHNPTPSQKAPLPPVPHTPTTARPPTNPSNGKRAQSYEWLFNQAWKAEYPWSRSKSSCRACSSEMASMARIPLSVTSLCTCVYMCVYVCVVFVRRVCGVCVVVAGSVLPYTQAHKSTPSKRPPQKENQ